MSEIMKKFIVFSVIIFIFLFSPQAHAQQGTIMQDKVTTLRAVVNRVISQEMRTIPGTDTKTTYQSIEVTILEGEKQGKQVTLDNDYLALKQGEVFFLVDTVRAEDGQEVYAVGDPDRLPALLFFAVLFVALVLIFGGLQGIRGLLSLCGSFLLIFFALLPGILHGYSPILVSIGVASLIIILGSYITHGFNKTTTSAVIGMIMTVIITGALAAHAVGWAHLSGFSSDEATYLNFNTRGTMDLAGLLLGGILIGLLGVLYDVAIGQAVSVEELYRAGPDLGRKQIFRRTLRIGREHIGALVNTLAIAYVGASLPLLLLFVSAGSGSYLPIINREIFADEIIRILIGSIGLVIAVPITTLLSVVMLVKKSSV